MKTLQELLIAARDLIETTGWNQGQYALKGGKTFYAYLSSGELADSYCLAGAFSKVAHDFWVADGVLTSEAQKPYNALAHKAGQMIVAMHQFDGCLADWNDQNPESDEMWAFIETLKAKNTPRDVAKVELNKFKQELKQRKIEPVVTKEKVLLALTMAIPIAAPVLITRLIGQ